MSATPNRGASPTGDGQRTATEVVVTSFRGDHSHSANVRRDDAWPALVTDQTSWVDQAAPPAATYVLGIRDDGMTVDLACEVT